MDWNILNDIAQLDQIVEESNGQPIVIFKHSTRCSISGTALGRVDRNWKDLSEVVKPYLLDLIAYRDISNEIADRFAIHHESPQLLLINKGECTYVESHLGIDVRDLKEELARMA